MANQSEDLQVECKELTEEQKNRASAADAAYCKACEEKGIKVCTWEEFEAWQKYVDGKIDESKLEEEAKLELDHYSNTFGKYLVIEKEDPVPTKEEEKKGRVKQANQIYKRVCEEREMGLCFFNNFATWTQYVEGKVSDSEFYERANLEVDKIKLQEA